MANPGDLSPENKAYYDEILETQGEEAAQRFLEQQLFYDSIPEDPVIEGTGETRGFPGRPAGGDVVPGVVFPAERTQEEVEAETQAKQNEFQRELLYQSRGFMLDEETQKAVKAATERYKAEGFPDEDRLKRQYEIEFEQGVPDFNLSGRPTTGLDNLALDDTEGREQLLQLGLYTDMRLKQDLGDRQSAQMKAIDDVYGFSGPRQPTALKAFGETKTPVRAGRVQMDPDVTEDMGVVETVVESLRPQVIVSGTDVRASRAQEEMDIRDLKAGLDTFLSKDENIDKDLDFWTDIYDTNVQMLANQLAPLPTDIGSMLDQTVREEYEQKYDEAVEIAERFAKSKIRTAINRIYEKDPDMRRNIEVNLDVGPEPFDMKSFGADALSFLATNEALPKSVREYLYRGGVLEDPDAITESVAMTALRDINFPLRLVINPAMAQAENIGLIQRRAADEEIETALPAARKEFTEQIDSANPLDILGAGIKEAAVETATMRSLGNDLAQVKSIGIPFISPLAQYMKGEEGYGFYNIDEEMRTTAPVMGMETSGADVMVMGGTAAELFIPIIPAAKFLSTAGSASAKTLAKGSKAIARTGPAQKLITKTGMKPQTFERLLTEGGATTIDLVATGGAPLALMEASRRIVPDLAGPLLKNQMLKQSAAKLGVARQFGRGVGPQPSVYDEILVGEKAVDDVASAVVELEIRARMSPEAADAILFGTSKELGFRPRFTELSQAEAKEILEGGLKSESAIVRDTVETATSQQPIFGRREKDFIADDGASVDTRVIETEGVNYFRMLDDYRDTFRTPGQQVIDDAAADAPIREGMVEVEELQPGEKLERYKEAEENIIDIMRARYYQLKQPGREYLIKAGIGDYVQLTPRTIVSKKWMDDNFGDVTKRMTRDGENKFIDFDGTERALKETGNPNLIILDFDEITRAIREIDGFKVNTNDPYFFEILQKAKNGEALSFDDFRYFNDRMVEEFARDGITRVAKDAELMDLAKLDPDTAPPIMDQLKGMRRGDLGTIYRATRDTLRPAAKAISNVAEEITLRWKMGVKGKDKAKQNRIMRELEAETVDTRNFTTEVDEGFARLDRTTKATFSQVSKAFKQRDFDELFPALKGMSKEEQVFVTIMSNQYAGKSFADIQTMSQEALFKNVQDVGRLIDNEVGTYADLVLREIMETYAGPLGSKAEIQDWLFANVRNNSRINISDANQLFENMSRQFPELNKIKIDKLDALVNMIISKETKSIITRAAKKNFGNRAGIQTTWANNPANGMFRVGGTTPAFTNPARYQKFIQDVFDVKINTPDGSTARGESMIQLVQKYNLAEVGSRPRKPIRRPTEPKRVDPPDDPSDTVGMERYARYSERMEKFDADMDVYTTRLQGYDDAQAIVEAFDGGASNSMIEYIIGVSGNKFDNLLTPTELVNSFRYKLTTMLDGRLRVLSPTEGAAFQRAQNALDTAEGSDIFRSNFMNLNKTETGRYARGLINTAANSSRRMLVQGMLGGKYLPNIVYHAENLLSAPLIAYVTNPKTTLSVLGQIPRSTGLTKTKFMPYYQLRMRASTEPFEMYPGTRYTNREMFDMFNQYNLGVSSQSIQVGDQLVADLRAMARKNRGIQANIDSLKQLGIDVYDYVRPGVTSPWMKWADEVDRAFRERIFIDAIRKGSSPATAADQARRVMLDYGMLPDFMKEGVGKAMLFFSFTWATSVEMIRAMTTQKGLLRVSALGNWHRNMARDAGTWMFNDNRAYESFWTSVNDDDGKSTAYTYIRSPYISNMMMLAELTGFGMGVMTGRSERSLETALTGLSKVAYIPGMDIFLAMDKDFKRSVPRGTMQQIMTDAYLPQFISGMTGIGGFNFEYAIDRYNIEVRPRELNVPGQQSFGGYQYRFRDNAGYITFLLDQLAMNAIGINRTYSDYYNEAVQSGLIDLPPNYYYGYDKKGTPLMYSLGRQRPMRLPKQEEAEIRKVKDTIRRLQQKTQQMKK